MIQIRILLFITLFKVIDGRLCYRCRYSVNNGCDIDMTKLKTSQHQVTCDTDCYAQIVKSSVSDEYEIVRDCSYYSECTEASYTNNGHTYISRCCKDDLCNADLGEDVFQCFDCEDTDGPTSTCQNLGFRDTTHYSTKTSFCGTFCEKTITSDGSNKKVVRRSCRNDCVEGTTSSFGITTETYCCTGDICNNVPPIKHRYMLFNILVVAWLSLVSFF